MKVFSPVDDRFDSSDVFYRFEMSELRRRKGGQAKDRNRNSSHANGSSKSGRSAEELLGQERGRYWWSHGSFLLGAVVALIVGVKYALYVRELHENDMWFSNIGVS